MSLILPPSVPLHPPKPPPSRTPFNSTQVGCLLPTKDIFLSSSSEETDEEIEEHRLILLIQDRERLFSEEVGNPLIRSLRCEWPVALTEASICRVGHCLLHSTRSGKCKAFKKFATCKHVNTDIKLKFTFSIFPALKHHASCLNLLQIHLIISKLCTGTTWWLELHRRRMSTKSKSLLLKLQPN